MTQPNNPLHGKTLKVILETLVKELGWRKMAEEIPIRCFQYEPSIGSSLAFLRKQEWARKKVEELYLQQLNVKPTKKEPKQTNPNLSNKYKSRR